MIIALTAILSACGIGLMVTLMKNERARKPLGIFVVITGLAALIVLLVFASHRIAQWAVGA